VTFARTLCRLVEDGTETESEPELQDPVTSAVPEDLFKIDDVREGRERFLLLVLLLVLAVAAVAETTPLVDVVRRIIVI